MSRIRECSTMAAAARDVAGAAAVAVFALPLKLNILVAIAAAVAICMLLEKPKKPQAPAGVTP